MERDMLDGILIGGMVVIMLLVARVFMLSKENEELSLELAALHAEIGHRKAGGHDVE
jgi:hypothetical protein